MEGIEKQESKEDAITLIGNIQRNLDNIIGDLDEGRNGHGETTVNENVIGFVKFAKEDLEKVLEKLS